MQVNLKIKTCFVIAVLALIILIFFLAIEAKWAGINKVFFNKIQLQRESYIQKRGLPPDYDVRFIGSHAVFELNLFQKGMLTDTLKVKIEGVDMIISGEYFHDEVIDVSNPPKVTPENERFRQEADRLKEEELALVYPNETPAQLRKRVQERRPDQGYVHSRGSGSFSNTLPLLPQGLNPEEVKAIYYPGSLEVTIGGGILWELHKLMLWPKGVRKVRIEF